MTSSNGIEFRLDTEHIRNVCRAVMPDATINVTHVDYPSAAYLDVDDKHRASQALRQVGYDTDVPNGELRVLSWSEPGLRARITSLIGTLERLNHGLPDIAARAIDAYATRFPHDYPPGSVEAARDDTLRALRNLLHQEVDTITGPRALHDPHIRPADGHIGELFDQARSLEHTIGQELHRARTVATYALDAYAQLRIQDGTGPSAARRAAITRAMAYISSASRRAHARPCADHPPPTASPGGNDAARLAATDVPQPATGASQDVAGDAAPPVRSPAPDRSPHRRAS